MKVAIIMGSNSDWPILEPAEKTLKEFGVEVEMTREGFLVAHIAVERFRLGFYFFSQIL